MKLTTGQEAGWKAAKREHILEEGFRLFSRKGIETVTMPEVAQASGVSRATLYRYFPDKTELVMAISTWKWEEYITSWRSALKEEERARMTAADQFGFFLDSFINLYRHHQDILRFHYSFYSFIRLENPPDEKKLGYTRLIDGLLASFHQLYEKGMRDRTIRTDLPERMMFSALFHILLATVTRYSVGLFYVNGGGTNPEEELLMLRNMLYAQMVRL